MTILFVCISIVNSSLTPLPIFTFSIFPSDAPRPWHSRDGKRSQWMIIRVLATRMFYVLWIKAEWFLQSCRCLTIGGSFACITVHITDIGSIIPKQQFFVHNNPTPLHSSNFYQCQLTISWVIMVTYSSISLQWRHNWCDGASNHQPHDCLLNRLFKRRPKKASKLRVTGLCAQTASNTENVSIWWRHHVLSQLCD